MRNFNQQDRFSSRRDFDRKDFRNRGERRKMFKAICSECGKDCEIPFEPRDGRSVYCSECFEKKEGGSRTPRDFHDKDNRDSRGSRRFDFERKETPVIQNSPQLQEISNKLDKILDVLINSYSKKVVEKSVIEEKKEPKTEKKKPKSTKKKS